MAMHELLLATSALVGGMQDLAFAPEPGTRLVKTFHSSLDVELEALTLEWADRRGPFSHLWSDVTLEEDRHSVLIDDYVALLENRPRTLLRSFESLSLGQRIDLDNRTNDKDFHETFRGHSILEGACAKFHAEPDSDSYSVTFEPERGLCRELLEGLLEDLDFRSFLPSGCQQHKSSWTVDAMALRSFFEPGGRVAFIDACGHPLRSFDPGFRDRLEGELQVEFGGRRVEEGTSCALLRIRGKPIARTGPEEHPGDVQLGLGYTSRGVNSITASLALDVSGEILWDLEGRHLRSAWLAAEVVVERETHGMANDGITGTWVRETWRGCVFVDVRVKRQ